MIAAVRGFARRCLPSNRIIRSILMERAIIARERVTKRRNTRRRKRRATTATSKDTGAIPLTKATGVTLDMEATSILRTTIRTAASGIVRLAVVSSGVIVLSARCDLVWLVAELFSAEVTSAELSRMFSSFQNQSTIMATMTDTTMTNTITPATA